MSYSLEVNRCEGWYRGVHWVRGKIEARSGKKPDQAEAVKAIRTHHKTGKWPREIENVPVDLCPHCGQPMPEE